MKAIQTKSLYFRGFNSVVRHFSLVSSNGSLRFYTSSKSDDEKPILNLPQSDHSNASESHVDQFVLYQQDYMNRQNWPDLRLGPLDPNKSRSRFPLPGELGFDSLTEVWQSKAFNGDYSLRSDKSLHRSPLPSAAGVISSRDMPLDRYRNQISTLNLSNQQLSRFGRFTGSTKTNLDEVYFSRALDRWMVNDKVEDNVAGVQTSAKNSEQATLEFDTTPNADRPVQFSVFTCPLVIRKHFESLFTSHNIKHGHLSVIVLSHRTKHDMSFYNADMSVEREQLMESFVEASREICSNLISLGFWADFIDPYTGTPHLGAHSNDTLLETDPRNRLFGITIEDLGCCQVVRHAEWGANVFTGLIFTNAPSGHSDLNEIIAAKK